MFQKNIYYQIQSSDQIKIYLKLSKLSLRVLIFTCKFEKYFDFSLQEKLSNSSGEMYGVSIFWMLVSKNFVLGSQELSNKILWVLSEMT